MGSRSMGDKLERCGEFPVNLGRDLIIYSRHVLDGIIPVVSCSFCFGGVCVRHDTHSDPHVFSQVGF